MALRPRKRAVAEIETGPFSDISFLLIIFFVLTTTFEKITGQVVDMPSAAPPPEQRKSDEAKTPTVNVMADRILLGTSGSDESAREITLTELDAALRAKDFPSRPQNDRVVIVEVAGDVKWDRYFKVVTTISRAGGVIALMERE